LESFSDYENRLPRGRTYVRNGSVCHLAISSGRIEALVSGSDIYSVNIEVEKLAPSVWTAIKDRCSGRIGSILELLQGQLSDEVMAVVAHRQDGLFPLPEQIEFSCSCPDWAYMCKHVAAVFYGIGHRLDTDPELLFELRGVDPQELITADIALFQDGSDRGADTLGDDALADIFGIDLDTEVMAAPVSPQASRKKTRSDVRTESEPAVQSVSSPKSKAARKTSTSIARAKTSDQPKAACKPKPVKKPETLVKPFTPTGPNIKKLRLAAGLSVEEFARRVQASVASVHRWESMRCTCKLHSRFQVALQELHAAQEKVGRQ
ncbi:MAG: hypothetical protein EOM25_15040, partial [Deltaproteobacteria bacterium]|nr:hypothetical protein [Deltaproteobacteria bacterium]